MNKQINPEETMSAIARREDAAIAPGGEAASLMEVISRAASDPNTDVVKLERVMALYERIEAKHAERDFAAAMTAAQNEMGRISADATNPQTRSRYASYAALDRVVRPIYTKHGFALSFGTGDAPGAEVVRVVCAVSHSGGHTRQYHVDMPADGKGAKGGDVMTKTHAVGAALSYGSRYLLKLIFNVAVGEDDDDGNSAGAGGPITVAELKELNEMLARCDGDPEKFCKYMKVDAMASIMQRDMGKAREALNHAIDTYQREKNKVSAQ